MQDVQGKLWGACVWDSIRGDYFEAMKCCAVLGAYLPIAEYVDFPFL